ncbi:unnamed protein product, partial [Medioppia subpectinata]
MFGEQQTDGYSPLMPTNLRGGGESRQQPHQHYSRSDYKLSGDEDDDRSSKRIMSSTVADHSIGPQFGRFCGQMSVRSATYFSDRNNVSLIVFVPSRASVVVHSFSLYLTYKFLPSRPAVTRFGPPSDPYELGTKIDGTYCDHVFTDCLANKKCKIR